MESANREPSVRFLQFGDALFRHAVDQVLSEDFLHESNKEAREKDLGKLHMNHNYLVQQLDKEYAEHFRKLLIQKHENEELFEIERLRHLRKQHEKEYKAHLDHLLMQKNAILIHLQLKFHKHEQQIKRILPTHLASPVKPTPFYISCSPLSMPAKPEQDADMSPETLKPLSNLNVDEGAAD